MKAINVNGRLLDFDSPKVMGILNLTPDSFFDGNKYTSTEKAIDQVKKMKEAGVDILDIGAASSRPGASKIGPEEEIKRIQEVLREVKQAFPDLVISIDTFHRKVAEYAINSGAHIINDISAWEIDEGMLDFVAEAKVPYIMMHMQGTPGNMQNNPKYDNVLSDVLKFFIPKLRKLSILGIHDVVIDPGFGFGKRLEDNYELLKHLSVFRILEKPILTGLSRKSMVYKLLDVEAEETLAATSALHLQALLNGASILRVHDVKEAVQAIALHKMLNKHN